MWCRCELLLQEQKETNRLLQAILHALQTKTKDNVSGGTIARTGDIMNPIQPGNTVKFLVTPAFSGIPFTLLGAQASVESSDPVNFPVSLDLVDDPTGATFESVIPSTAAPVGGAEAVVATWKYTNLDGTVAVVTGTVTELGIVDDVTGGTFAQVS